MPLLLSSKMLRQRQQRVTSLLLGSLNDHALDTCPFVFPPKPSRISARKLLVREREKKKHHDQNRSCRPTVYTKNVAEKDP